MAGAQGAVWLYRPPDASTLVVRAEPRLEGALTRFALRPGEVVLVAEERVDSDGVTHLRLADGRGWVFDRRPGGAPICVREGASQPPPQASYWASMPSSNSSQSQSTQVTLWRFDGRAPFALLGEASLGSPRTGEALEPDEVFCAVEERVGPGCVLYLRVADGRGWVVDSLPGAGRLCSRHVGGGKATEHPPSDLWLCRPDCREAIEVIHEPASDAAGTGDVLQPGDVFQAVEEVEDDNGAVFLRLSDGTGWVCDHDPDGMEVCVRHEAPVTLHIYDVPRDSTGQRINGVFRVLGTGAFHAGVEIFGQEWSFGSSERADGTGVFVCAPGGCEAHTYREAVPMGHTPLTEQEVRSLIDELSAEWGAEGYDLLRHNCCHFSDELCDRLGVGRVPGWVRTLAGIGRVLDDGRHTIALTTRAVIARGKSARGASPTSAYRFGDLSRGLVLKIAGLLTDPSSEHRDMIEGSEDGDQPRRDRCLSDLAFELARRFECRS